MSFERKTYFLVRKMLTEPLSFNRHRRSQNQEFFLSRRSFAQKDAVNFSPGMLQRELDTAKTVQKTGKVIPQYPKKLL
jgi:hypothetical protein